MKRQCLKCRKDFISAHKGNRLCVRCNHTNIVVGRMESQSQGKRSRGIGRTIE